MAQPDSAGFQPIQIPETTAFYIRQLRMFRRARDAEHNDKYYRNACRSALRKASVQDSAFDNTAISHARVGEAV